jgi:hypothetical protein
VVPEGCPAGATAKEGGLGPPVFFTLHYRYVQQMRMGKIICKQTTNTFFGSFYLQMASGCTNVAAQYQDICNKTIDNCELDKIFSPLQSIGKTARLQIHETIPVQPSIQLHQF